MNQTQAKATRVSREDAPVPHLRLWKWKEMFPKNRIGYVQAYTFGEATVMVKAHLAGKMKYHAPSFSLTQVLRDPNDVTLPSKPFVLTLRPQRKRR